jgi:hypothetical protein
MNFEPLTAEQYLAIVNRLVPLGWMPVGAFGSMTFRKNGRNYDFSAADLNQLERIERDGLFVISA